MERGRVLRSYFNGGNMTDKKKISILERLLDERDKQIQELQMRITELEETVESYSALDDEVQELHNLVKEAKRLNSELNSTRHEQLQTQKEYRKEMRTFFRNHKTSKFRYINCQNFIKKNIWMSY